MGRRIRWAATLTGLLLLVAGSPAAAQEEPAPPPPGPNGGFGHYRPQRAFTERHVSSFYLPMRDGVRLAVTVARPARNRRPAEGRFPVIWHHSLSATQEPADGTGPRAGGFRAMPTLTDHGYVVVQVARRGNGQSFGERRGYHDRNEAHDAYEVTQWLAAQPWSTGKVGIYGCSNTGDAGLQAVTVRPPALKAAFLGCFSWHKYDAFRRGGIFAQWGTGPSRTVEQDMDQKPVDGDEDKKLLRQAAEEHQRSTNLFEMWKEMPFRDSFSRLVSSRFWAEGSTANYADQIRRAGVALYIVGGWYDELRDQGALTWLNVPGSRLLVGPWKHCANDGFPLVEEAHRFFDYHLKGLDTGLAREAPIHYWTVNAQRGGEWRSAASWPVAGVAPARWLLGPNGALLQPGRATPRSAPPTAFKVRYDVTCQNGGMGPNMQPCHIPGAGASFKAGALAADTEITGSGVADLWISADAADTNLFAHLEDVAPDGSVRVVTEGRQKASLRAVHGAPWNMPPSIPWHRSFGEDAKPLKAGEPVRLVFELMPISWVFKAGHRIQLTVTGADWRERARDPSALATSVRIHSDRARPSSITLPSVRRQ